MLGKCDSFLRTSNSRSAPSRIVSPGSTFPPNPLSIGMRENNNKIAGKLEKRGKGIREVRGNGLTFANTEAAFLIPKEDPAVLEIQWHHEGVELPLVWGVRGHCRVCVLACFPGESALRKLMG